MGILRSFLWLGMLISLGAVTLSPLVIPAWTSAVQEEKDDDSSGRWEGVAMASLVIPHRKKS